MPFTVNETKKLMRESRSGRSGNFCLILKGTTSRLKKTLFSVFTFEVKVAGTLALWSDGEF